MLSHITAALILLTLAGSPVTSAVCAMVCGHGTAPTAHCHDATTGDAPDAAIAADIVCGALVPDTPYVKENIPSPQPATSVVITHVGSPAPRPLALHTSDETAAGAWLKPPLILRR